MRNRLFTLLGFVGSVTLAHNAAAQDQAPSIQLNQYEQPVAGDALFATPAPWVGGHLVPRGMLSFDYAADPLVLVDGNGNVIATPVTSQAHLHFGLSFALWDRLGISLNFPVAVAQGGDEALATAPALQAASDAAPGDLRLGLRGRILGEYYDPFQLGLGAYIYVPTGTEGGYTGEGAVYGKPHLLLGGRVPMFVWSASAGAVLRGSDNPHTFTYSIGGGVVVLDDTLQIGPEIFGAVALEDKPLYDGTGTTPLIDRKGSVNAELLIGAKYRFLKWFVGGLAAGPGLSNGVGTPQYRIVASLAYDPQPDKDKPIVAAPKDRDGDGILDKDDACPDVKGVRDADPAKNGCPPDKDGDGILDKDDACPDVPGVKSKDPKKHGCPPDKDGDGIFDADDACVDVPGVPDKDPAKHGCPKVVVTDKEIKILQKIEFDFDKATIKPVSDPVIDEVARVMKENPDIELIEVQGHTDNMGSPFYNRQLSDKRAEAVKNALISRGIEAKRLRSKGYGQEKPIADNKTDEGRAENRRVQFQIVTRKKK